MRILLRTPNWLGDCIMSLSVLPIIREGLPNSRIVLLTRPNLAGVFQYLDGVEEVIPGIGQSTPGNIVSVARDIRSRRFDRGLLLTNSWSSALMFRLGGISTVVGYRNEGRGLLLSRSLPMPSPGVHYIRFYQELAEFFAGTAGHSRNYYHPPRLLNRERQRAREILKEQGMRSNTALVGMAPFSAYGSAKEWPKFPELIRMILKRHPEVTIAVLGSHGERDRSRSLVSGLPPKRVVHLAGVTDLRESLAIIRECAVFVCNDSGLMHAAAAFSVPLVAMYGPTPRHRTVPDGEAFTTLYRPVDCAPCRHRECPGDHRCMRIITVEEVYRSLVRNLPRKHG